MATRFRLPSAGSAGASPGFQSYSHAGSGTRFPMPSSGKGDSSALSTVAQAPDAADHTTAGDTFHVQFVSDPLVAGIAFVTADSVKYAMQSLEANAGNNLFVQLFVGVLSASGSPSINILLQKSADGTELGTSIINRTSSHNLTGAYTTVSGDRLFVEFSVTGTPVAASGTQGHNASLRWGSDGAGGDLPEDDTSTGATLNPWIEFSRTITFTGPTANASLVEDADSVASGASVTVAAAAGTVEDGDSVAAGAAISVSAAAGMVEDSDSVASAVSLAVGAAADLAEDTDNVTAGASITVTASASTVEDADNVTSVASITITAAAILVEDADSVAASADGEGWLPEILRISWAQVELPEASTIGASLAATESDDTAVGVAALSINAVFASIEETDVVSASIVGVEMLRISWAQLELPQASGISASLSATEADDLAASVSTLAISAAFAQVEANDTLAASVPGLELLRISWAQLELPASAGGINASLSANEGDDALSATGTVSGGASTYSLVAEGFDVTVEFAPGFADYELTAAPFTVDAAFEAGYSSYALSAEAFAVTAAFADVGLVQGAGGGGILAVGLLTEGDDACSASAALPIVASMAKVEADDSLDGLLGLPRVLADYQATEADDTVTASVALVVAAAVQINEADDVSSSAAAILVVAQASIQEGDDTIRSGWGPQHFPAAIVASARARRMSAGNRRVGSIRTSRFP
jgi:hypothetical protein